MLVGMNWCPIAFPIHPSFSSVEEAAFFSVLPASFFRLFFFYIFFVGFISSKVPKLPFISFIFVHHSHHQLARNTYISPPPPPPLSPFLVLEIFHHHLHLSFETKSPKQRWVVVLRDVLLEFFSFFILSVIEIDQTTTTQTLTQDATCASYKISHSNLTSFRYF